MFPPVLALGQSFCPAGGDRCPMSISPVFEAVVNRGTNSFDLFVEQSQGADSPTHLPLGPSKAGLVREDLMLFTEGQAFLRSHDVAPRPLPTPLLSTSCLSFSVFLCNAGLAYRREGGRGQRGQAWRRIIRPQESLALYNPFNTLYRQSSYEQVEEFLPPHWERARQPNQTI